ncbi:GNAT family N-acetyltransferase [Schleiferiaceae bacterium]|nr:GNAT family N-acetyltransferase [Schleiferiaceae bacterium]
MTNVKISVLKDLEDIAICHQSAFPKALASRQGRKFVSKMLEWYIVSDRGTLFHLRDASKVVGYVGAIYVPEPGLIGAASSITQYAFKSFITSILIRPWLFLHPDVLRRVGFIFKNLSAKLGLKKDLGNLESDSEDFKSHLGLVVIGVERTMQGKGVGARLMNFLAHMAKEDFKVNRLLLTVAKSNKKALKSYQSNGWTIRKDEGDHYQLVKEL